MQTETFFVDRIDSMKRKQEELKKTQIQRMQMVRSQEYEFSKQLIKEGHLKTSEMQKNKEIIQKYEDYMKKLKEIEELNFLKEKNLNEIGNLLYCQI